MSVQQVDDFRQVERFTSYDAKRLKGFLAVPLSAIRQHKQAAQTLGALLEIIRDDGSKVFRGQKAIASAAGLHVRTVRRHLAKLESSGAVKIDRDGETHTITLTSTDSVWFDDGFVPLCKHLVGRSWAERIVYGWIVYRANISRDQSSCGDSLRHISRSLRLALSTVQSAFDGLVADGLMTRETPLEGHNSRSELLAPDQEIGCTDSVRHPKGCTDFGPGCTGSVRSGVPVLSSPYLRRTKQEVPRKHMEQICFSIDELTPTAGDVFRRAGYRRDDGGNLWKLAGLLVAGLISERELWDACHGCRECSPSDRPAYVVAIVKKHLADRGADLRELLGRVRIQPNWPKGPPKTVESERAEKQAESMSELLKRRGFV